jgi:pristinamycin I synthase-3/4
MKNSKTVESLYPLSPMQHGMLFHALQEPDSGLYFAQLVYTLEGDLDVALFEAAWQATIDRHAVLRTAFSWKGARPLQAVFPRAKAALHRDDWRGLTAEDQRGKLRAFLSEDRERGFDLSRAPLMRLALFRIKDDGHHFVWSNHHTILDGWSAMLVIKEALARYEAATAGRPLHLPEIRPYRDYISWLSKWDKAGAEKFWRKKLAGFTDITPAPLSAGNRAGRSGQDFRIKRFSAEQTAAMNRVCAARRITLNTLVQGAWGLLLARYTGSREAIFGATVSGRPVDLPGSDTMVGLLINTIPVRISYQPDANLWDWLAALQLDQLEARHWGFAPLAEAQGWSEIPRGKPLFESLLVFENYAGDAFEQNYALDVNIAGFSPLHGYATGQEYTGQTYKTNYPLLATARPGSELFLRLTYERARLSDEAVETLLAAWSALLESAAQGEVKRIIDLPFTAQGISGTDGNEVALSPANNETVVSMFERRAAAFGSAQSVISGGVCLTFESLNARANQLGAHLRSVGIGPEARVAMLLDPGIEAVIGILAILKCGGAYVPLDARSPIERLGYQIESSNAVAILTTSALRSRLPASWVQVIEIDSDWPEIEKQDDANLEGVSLQPENAAYLIFTSGSTGRPKGVVVTHSGLANYVQAVSERIGFERGRYALVSSLAADLGHTMLFPALCRGGLLDVISHDLARDGAGLANYFANNAPDYLKITPSHLRGLIDAAGDAARALLPLRKLALGGEASDSDWVASLRDLRPECGVWNHYGPTEYTVGALVHRADGPLETLTLPLGRPLAGRRAYVLDSFGDPAPPGVSGELYLGGAGVARGYEAQPAATAERFVPDPFGTQPGDRLYRTGDLVMRLASGDLEFLGRTDHQVKFRGHRIELGEIEAVLRTHPAVSDAAASVRDGETGDKRIVAYVASDQTPDLSDLRDHVARTLPDYMIPGAFVFLPALPLLPNGKLDRRALPEPESAAQPISTEFHSPVEEIVASIWEATLGVEIARRPAFREDDFFALGGHSLLGTQVVSRLREALGVELPLRTLFDRPKLCDLASEIETLRRGATRDAPPLTRARREGPVVCSFAQQRLWFIEQLDPGNFAYNIPRALRMTGALDVSALRDSLSEIVKRHEALRTVLVNQNGSPAQVIREEFELKLPVIDLTVLSSADREKAAWGIGLAEARLPFDLATGPLFRATLLRLDECESVLALNLHHIVSDVWSAGVFVDELSALYKAFRLGRPSPLPELPIQYADFAVWQRAWLDGEYLSNQLSYWMRRLDGVTVLQIPTDRPRPTPPSRQGADIRFTIPADLTARLEQLAQREGVTLYMVVLAAFQFLLGIYAGQEDVATASPIANRNRLETERLIGFFVNTLVMRNRIELHLTFRELLARVRETVLDAYAHQDLPFERLVEELQPERDFTRSPLFQVVLTFQNAPLSELDLPGLSLKPFGKIDRSAKHDLILFVEKQDGALECLAEYAADLFEERTIERLLASLRQLFQSVVENPSERLRDLSALTPVDEKLLLNSWSVGRDLAPAATNVCEWFERIVEAHSDRIALGFGSQSVSYGELNRRANQLARTLRSYGVEPEVRVALCVERGVEMVVGLLGILKSGGAYTPLDASYPLERLAYMVEDAGAPVVVTQEHLRERLPWGWAQILTLDSGWDEIARQDDQNPEHHLAPANLAYVIYTSGSTGKPKAADLIHRGAINLAQALHDWFRVVPGTVVMQFASLSFDSATWDWMMALLAGGKLVLASRDEILPGVGLERVLDEQQVEVVLLTPSVVERMDDQRPLPALRSIAVAGEACPAKLFERWGPGRWMVNAYGPTEITVCSSLSEGQTGERGVSIGRPLPNLRSYVLGAERRLAPIGAPGELYVGGIQIARGYANRPALTAERFVPDAWSGEPGARLYRTGDVVRWRADGELEFIGRADGQVKLRGYRIELGEIEAAIGEHRDVAQAAVALRRAGGEEKQLVAYVTPKRARLNGEARIEDEKIAEWRMTFEGSYSQTTREDHGAFHIGGWTSSYTGDPIPAEEMRQWVDHTVERIRELGPRRALEIGCGTGLLLFPLAPECELYFGTDFASDALQYVRRQAVRSGLKNVELRQAPAHQFDDLTGQAFDTVILNSVVQYFPDAEYLARVLKGAANLLRGGGAIFVGDVRSLPLLEAFHTSVEIHRSGAEERCEAVWQRVQERLRREQELVIDPGLFFAIGAELGARRVEVMPKRGGASNELISYRYDVQMHIGAPPQETGGDLEWQGWERGGWTVDRLEQYLRAERPEGLAMVDVPNRRVAAAAWIREAFEGGKRKTLKRMIEESRQAAAAAVDPESLWRLARDLSYEFEVSWARADRQGRYDVVFRRADRVGAVVRWPQVRMDESGSGPIGVAYDAYVNDLGWERRARRLREELPRYVGRRLPDHMTPTVWVMVERLPLSPNGKLDRLALPDPKEMDAGSKSFEAPRGQIEEQIAGVWRQVLSVERIGREDNFFERGGHSLLATQVISRLRDLLGIELPLRSLFEAQTVRALAAHFARMRSDIEAPSVEPGPVPVDRSGDLSLSFAQQRLWFLNQLDPESAAYNIPTAFSLKGEVNLSAVTAALNAIVERHEVLRTRFVSRQGEPVQRVLPHTPFDVPVTDLSGESSTRRERLVEDAIAREASTHFDLETEPPLRAALNRLGEGEHLLLLTIHHIAADGWSAAIFAREFHAFYQAHLRGMAPPLAPLPLQYGDFAVWQRKWLEGETLERQLAYWRTNLSDLTPLNLPKDRPDRGVGTRRGEKISFELSPETGAGLHRLSQRGQTTLFAVALATWQILLSRYGRQDDIAVGCPVANRTHLATEGLIGCFANTLVLRSRVDNELSFEEFLSLVAERVLDAQSNQDVPFEKLVEELAPDRDLSRNPFFQVMLAFQNAPDEDLRLGDLIIEPVRAGTREAKFDLTLNVRETQNGGLSCHLEYASDLFDRQTAEQMCRHWRATLEAVTRDASVHIREISLLDSNEVNRITQGWNATAQAYPERSCLHHLVSAQALLTPGSIAVSFNDAQITYGELERRSGQLANYLVRAGFGGERPIGVLLDRSCEMVISLLGILKAGAAYLPLETSLPADRLQFMVEDAEAQVIVSTNALAGRVPFFRGMLLRVDDDWPLISRAAPEAPADVTTPDHLAYVIYTSGSTGKPKAVMVPHRGMVSRVSWMLREFGMGPRERLLQKTPLGFDASAWEFYVPLASGSCLVMAEPERHGDSAYLAHMICERQITALQVVPSMLGALLDEPLFPECRSLKWLFCGAEALPREMTRRFFGLFPGDRRPALTNLYGPTEASPDVTSWTCGDEEQSEIVPIGKPIANTQIYILDEEMRPAPPGVPGELFIGGVALARGYWGRPSLTVERFLPDPYGGSGARLYRTGDLARFRTDGRIEFLGRIDHQVKIRGFRIETGEVESVLGAHPAVRKCAVVAWESGPGERRLVAYVVPQSGERPSPGEFRAHLQRQLPDYMVPGAFVELESLPLNGSGKLDRNALPEPNWEHEASAQPASPIECVVADLWSSLLRIGAIGRDANFFELGGHSLLATRMMSRVRTLFNVELPLRTVFESPVLEEFASRVAEARRKAPAQKLPSIRPADRSLPLPLSTAQRRLWLTQTLEPESAAYNVIDGMLLHGPLDIRALRRGVAEIVRRHEILRTRFVAEGAEPVQVIEPALTIPVAFVDLSEVPVSKRDQTAKEIAGEQTRKAFDLSLLPLLRLLVIKMSDARHALVATMHHIINDGWSMGVLGNEFRSLYRRFASGESVSLPELRLQYADYAAWERGITEGRAAEEALSYWRKQLSDVAEIELPKDRPRPRRPSHRSGVIPLEVGAETLDGLKRVGRSEGTTLFMTLTAALEMAISRFSGRELFPLGTTFSNRGRPELEGLLGFFANQVVLRAEVPRRSSARELLRSVRDTALDAYDFQQVPFERIVEAVATARNGRRQPLFDAKIVLNAAEPDSDGGGGSGLSIDPWPIEGATAKFDLLLLLTERGNELRGALEFDADIYDRSTAERIAHLFESILKSMISDEDVLSRPVEQLLEIAERDRWNKLRERAERASAAVRHSASRRAIAVPASRRLVIEDAPTSSTLPLVVRPARPDTDLVAWGTLDREEIRRKLLRFGGILFRGFDVRSRAQFADFVRAISGEPLEYSEQSSPRTAVGGNIYTSTDHPADQRIFLHCENSYRHTWPLKIFFICEEAAESGGQTPIADVRRVLARIPAAIRERFAEKGVMYLRNYGQGVGLPWQQVFGADSRAEVESYCRRTGIEYEWRERDCLTTRQIRHAIVKHPETGEAVWFNHAAFFHVSTLEQELRRTIVQGFEERRLPSNTYYGDESPIEEDDLEKIRAAYESETVIFNWQNRDVLMLDNMLVAHGRMPYSGSRRVLVAMSEVAGASDT